MRDPSPEPTFRTDRYLFIKRRLDLDLSDLDIEVAEMPALMQDCGECTAIANEIKDAAKEELERVEAETAEELRRTVTAGGKPPSESSIESRLPTFKQVQDALAIFQIARLDAVLWQSLMSALQSKSYSLGNIATLVSAGFTTRDHLIERRRQQINRVRQERQAV